MSHALTTDSVAPSDRLDYWREMICAVYVKLDAEPINRNSFSGSVSWSSWGDTTISRVASAGQTVTRRVDGASSDCLLSLQIRGTGAVTQTKRTALLYPGDFALYSATEPYQLSFENEFDQLVVQFPRDALIARNVDIESTVARTVAGSTGLGAVVTSFIRSMSEHQDEIKAEDRSQLGSRLVDFAAISLRGSSPELPLCEFNRRRILAYIDQNLHDSTLSVASIARAFAVSSRTLQKLFAADELQLAARIRHSRLSRAREALREPRCAHLTIAAIAASHGFGGPTQFARAFRAAYGTAPTAYRSGAP